MARPVRLKKEASAGEAFVSVARNCIEQMRANEACVRRGRDPEGVHQMRVAARRLRALLACYRDCLAREPHAILSASLGWLLRRLGPAREWDVFIAETLDPLDALWPDETALGALREEARRRQARSRRTAQRAPDEPRYGELLLLLERWLASGAWATPAAESLLARPARELADAVLRRRHKRVRKFAGKRAALSRLELHRLRLLCKKFRYAVEYFRDLYPKRRVERFLASLTEIQAVLGSLNDAAVNAHLLAAATDALMKAEPALAARANGLVRSWERAHVRGDLQGFADAWARYRRLEPYWK